MEWASGGGGSGVDLWKLTTCVANVCSKAAINCWSDCFGPFRFGSLWVGSGHLSPLEVVVPCPFHCTEVTKPGNKSHPRVSLQFVNPTSSYPNQSQGAGAWGGQMARRGTSLKGPRPTPRQVHPDAISFRVAAASCELSGSALGPPGPRGLGPRDRAKGVRAV